MNYNIVIYQGKNGEITFKGDVKQETIWASQAQIVELFGVDQSVVSRHIRNIFKDGEIVEKSNMQKMHIANSDKPVTYYSLDVILAVGYRTNSRIAVEFRKWASQILRQHILKGYTINKKQLIHNYDEFLQTIEIVKKLLPVSGQVKAQDVLELVKLFANTWLSLDAYDKSSFPKVGASKKQINISAKSLQEAIDELKANLVQKGEASELFAQERQKEAVGSIYANVFQSVFGQEVYQTLEEKSAYLLYFFVKNHPFVDGNKRSGAFAFVWFLQRAKILDTGKITPEALTTLTLLIAESKPEDKDKMIGLILQLLKK